MNAPRAYYNEVDPYAAEWLRNLIAAGEIALGDVDERDIRDVRPADLDGYTQCHFFAGVGIWSRALRTAGWPDSRPVWTGSCPCQPFSAAGAALGFDDERHLWPDWHWLIEQHRPETVLGEQVASADGLVWADLVSADLEATGYAAGFVDTCAAGFRSFHIRQRLYFAAHLEGSSAVPGYSDTIRRFGGVGHADGPRSEARIPEAVGQREGNTEEPDNGSGRLPRPDAGRPKLGGLADEPGDRRREERPDGRGRGQGDCAQGRPAGSGASGKSRGLANAERLERNRRRASEAVHEPGPVAGVERRGDVERLANTDIESERGRPELETGAARGTQGKVRSEDRKRLGAFDFGGCGDLLADPFDGYWRDADWLFCWDGVWRPVEPGTFPLAHAAPARLGRLRAYGNGLDLAQATGFVRACLERDLGRPIAGDLFEFGELSG